MKNTILAYVPVLHRGYVEFFRKYGGPKSRIYVLGRDLIGEFDYLRKDIRALDPVEAVKAIRALELAGNVKMADISSLNLLSRTRQALVMPEDEISRALAEKYLSGCSILFHTIFLRWDKNNSIAKNDVIADRKILADEFVRTVMNRAYAEAKKSSDWWRRVGAVIFKNGEVLVTAFNRHVPSQHMPYVFGDPRSNFKKGINIEISTAFHAEASAIAVAAAKGIGLQGSSIFVTTFSCPPCAKLIAYSGIKRLYFKEGYSMLDAQNILSVNNVEIVLVKN